MTSIRTRAIGNAARASLWAVAATSFWQTPTFAADVPKVVATVQSDVETNLPAGKYSGLPKCDPQGNVYILGPVPTSGEATAMAGIQVLRIDATGNIVATYPPQLPSGIEGPARFVDFAGDGIGGLVALIVSLMETGGTPIKRSGPYLAKFNSDGSVNTISLLDVGDRFIPAHLEVMANGQLFLTGLDREDRSAMTMLFDRNGGNSTKVETSEKLDKSASAEVVAEFRESIRLASIAVGTDGNVYVVRRSLKPVVIVISSSGQLVRRFTVESPSSDLAAIAARQSGSRLAIAFAPKTGDTAPVVRMVDTSTLQVQSDLVLGDNLKGQVACYAANGSLSMLVTEKKPEGLERVFHLKTTAP